MGNVEVRELICTTREHQLGRGECGTEGLFRMELSEGAEIGQL